MYELPHGETTAAINGGCWVCSSTRGSQHSHHIIPRNAGGEKGPQVLLCNDCHEAIHHAAKMEVDADTYSVLEKAKQRWIGQGVRKRASFLIALIINSEGLISKSVNKTTKINLELSGEENEMLEYWARRLRLSKANALKHMLKHYRG